MTSRGPSQRSACHESMGYNGLITEGRTGIGLAEQDVSGPSAQKTVVTQTVRQGVWRIAKRKPSSDTSPWLLSVKSSG